MVNWLMIIVTLPWDIRRLISAVSTPVVAHVVMLPPTDYYPLTL
jgi:hypothetical protein